MIFIRATILVVAAIGLVGVLGPGGPGPGPALAGRELVRDRAAATEAALARLDTALAPALEAARQGAARVVAGEEPAGPPLAAAADDLRAAQPTAIEATRAVEDLNAARRALAPGASPVALPVSAAEIGSIADQLARTADAADGFAAMRRRAEQLTERLASALAEMEARELTAAREQLAAARVDHGALAAWEIGLLTLPVWLETTGDMIDAVGALLDALEAGDAAAAEVAADRVAALDEEAASADRALRIAMAEGGASVTAAPLGRLAAALADLADARAAVASILQSVGR